MKIIVAYPTLNSTGGAQRVCLHVLKTLQKREFDVTVATIDRTNWSSLEKVFGESFRPNSELYMFPRIPTTPTLTLRQALVALSYAIELFLIKLKGGYDLLMNMSGEMVDSIGEVIYINAIPLRLMHIYPQIQPRPNAQWRCYSRLYSFFTRILRSSNGVVVTNSRFNQSVINKDLGVTALVVYPPVNIEKIEITPKNQKRANVVVTVSRFRSAKRLEIIPKVAERVKNCDFILIGTVDKDSKECLKQIYLRGRKLQVQSRIRIFMNKPFRFVSESLSKAKVFLHTQPLEAFGMSVVEAMAAGCVPVVPKNGGPWFDILDHKQGEYGYSYRSVEEAAEIIEMLVEDDVLRREVSARAVRRTMFFNSSVFDKKILGIIEKTLSLKG